VTIVSGGAPGRTGGIVSAPVSGVGESRRTMVEQLRKSVLEHAQAEEDTVFSRLAGVLDDGRLRELAGRYQRAKSKAPTHPHPHAPDTPPGNMVMGPVAALVDRIRDARRRE
jgi:hypothetical protein